MRDGRSLRNDVMARDRAALAEAIRVDTVSVSPC
jgi:hypothetical protein